MGVQPHTITGLVEERAGDYVWDRRRFPNVGGWHSGIRVDDTILPGGALESEIQFGLWLRTPERSAEAFEGDSTGGPGKT